MGLNIDESIEAHYSTESIRRTIRSTEQAERTGRNTSRPKRRENWQQSKSRNSRSSDFCTHCRKTVHKVSDCWSMKTQENGWRFNETWGQSDLNNCPNGNQVNVVESQSGEILPLEELPIGEAGTWLLDSGATFHMTPNMVFKLFGRSQRHNTTRQRARVCNRKDWQSFYSIANGNTITLHRL